MKKAISSALVVLMVLMHCLCCLSASNPRGDVDGDGEATPRDARLAMRQALDLERLDAGMLAAADVTGDGLVTAEDARAILRISLQLPFFEDAETRAVENMLAAMSTKEKIEQMIMTDVRYFDGKGVETLNGSLTAFLQNHAFAGVIFFAQNTANAEKTLRLANAVQAANAKAGRTQLFVATDQEGGKVARLGTGTGTPGNMALGAIGSEEAAREAAGIIGEELFAAGINADFAPVLDLNNNPSNPVIGVRSFSDSPALAAKLGAAYVKGLQDRGVIATLKHFPGHGDTGTDSHTGLPRIEKNYAQLKENELVPFAAAIEEGAEMIMTAHIQFPSIEKETYVSKKTGEAIELPATLSKTIITDVLRGDMGFEGVVITDAMVMDAIAEHFDPTDAAVLAIGAGADILLMPVSPHSDEEIAQFDAYIDNLAALAEKGAVSLKNVNDAVRRILRLKYRKGLFTEYAVPDLEARVAAVNACWGSEAHRETEWALAKRAVTLVKNDDHTLPLQAEGKKLVFLAADPDEVLSIQYGAERLRDEGKLPASAEILYGCYTSAPLETVLSEIENADCVIAVSELYRASALDPRTDDGKTNADLDAVIDAVHAGNGKFVLVSANLPYDTARFRAADAILVCWSDKGMSEDPRVRGGDVTQYGPNIPAAVYLALSPDEGPTGNLPVNVPKLTAEYTYGTEILYPFGFGMRY